MPDTVKPAERIIVAAAPNPFNPAATITFTLPEAGRAAVTIYNLAGQRVALLADRQFTAGTHDVRWDAGDFASGVYVAVVTAGGRTGAVKLTLVR